MKSKIIIVAIVIVALVGLYRLLSVSSVTGSPESAADIVIYWGIGCPHCEKVKEYIQSNHLDQKLKITLKEVYYNKQNQTDLQATLKKCPQLDAAGGVGVPLAFVTGEQRCLSGDTPIITFFRGKLGTI